MTTRKVKNDWIAAGAIVLDVSECRTNTLKSGAERLVQVNEMEPLSRPTW